MPLKKFISSGQTGVERAALDSAIKRNHYAWGGYAPRGRLAEDGEISSSYFEAKRLGCGLHECDKSRPGTARFLNVREADATLILRVSKTGSVLPESIKIVIKNCRKLEKPYRILDPTRISTVPRAVQWICETRIKEAPDEEERDIETLNVVGPSESKSPGIYDASLIYLTDIGSFAFTHERWGIKIWAPRPPTHRYGTRHGRQ